MRCPIPYHAYTFQSVAPAMPQSRLASDLARDNITAPGARNDKYSVCVVCNTKSTWSVQKKGKTEAFQQPQVMCNECESWFCSDAKHGCGSVLEDGWRTRFEGQDKILGPVRCKPCVTKLVLVGLQKIHEAGPAPLGDEHLGQEGSGVTGGDATFDFTDMECSTIPHKAGTAPQEAKQDHSEAVKEQLRLEEKRKADLRVMNGFNSNLISTQIDGTPAEERQRIVCLAAALCDVTDSLITGMWQVLSKEPDHWIRQSHDCLKYFVPTLAHYLSLHYAPLHRDYGLFRDLVHDVGANWRDNYTRLTMKHWAQFFFKSNDAESLYYKLRVYVSSIVHAFDKARSGATVHIICTTYTSYVVLRSHVHNTLTICGYCRSSCVHNECRKLCTMLCPFVPNVMPICAQGTIGNHGDDAMRDTLVETEGSNYEDMERVTAIVRAQQFPGTPPIWFTASVLQPYLEPTENDQPEIRGPQAHHMHALCACAHLPFHL